MRSCIVVAVLTTARVAAAQAPGEVPVQAGDATPVASEPAPVPREGGQRSAWTAYALTVGSIAVPCAIASFGVESDRPALRDASGMLCTAALVLGPSVGQWYAGRGVTTGLVVRVAAVGGLIGLAYADPHLDHVGTFLGIVGAVGVFETGMLWDLVTLPRAVRRYNREHAVVIAPMATAGGGGVALSGAF